MSMLKRFIKKNDHDRQGSPSVSPRRQIKSDDEAQGFICPMCMVSLNSADALQTHFYTEHDASSDRADNGALSDLSPKTFRKLTQNELDMNKQLLRASEESRTLLGAEVHSLQSQIKQLNEQLIATKTDKTTFQNKAATLAGEVASCKARADESEAKKVAHEDHIITLKSQLTEKTKLVQDLETQLNERPSADDVAVLKKELVQVQTFMDDMAKEKEQERSRLTNELSSMCNQNEQSVRMIKALELEIATRPRVEDVQLLQASLSDKEHIYHTQSEEIHKRDLTIQQLNLKLDQHIKDQSASDAEVGNLRDEVVSLTNSVQEVRVEKEQEIGLLRAQQEKTCTQLEAKTSQLEELTNQLTTVTEKLQKECSTRDELEGRLRDKDAILETEIRNVASRDNKIVVLEHELVASQSVIERQEVERNDLLTKIETGEGADTAINQLKTENSLLQEKLTNSEKNVKDHASDSHAKLEQLQLQTQDVKGQLQAAQEKGRRSKSLMVEKDEQIVSLEQRVQAMGADLVTKNEMLVTSGSSKAAQRFDLENHIQTIQTGLTQKTEEAEKLKQSVEQLHADLTESSEKSRCQDQKLGEELSKLNNLQQKHTSLQSEMDKQKKLFKECKKSDDALKSEVLDVKKQREELQAANQMILHKCDQDKQSFEEKVTGLKQQLSEQKKQFTSEKDDLKNQLETGLGEKNLCLEDVEGLKADLKIKVENMESLKVDLTTSCDRNKDVEEENRKIKENEKELQNQVTVLQEKETVLSQEKSELKAEVERLNSEVQQANTQYKEVSGVKVEVEQRLENELSASQAHSQLLEGQVESVKEELLQSETTVDGCKRDIEQLETSINTLTTDKDQLINDLEKMRKDYDQVETDRQRLDDQQNKMNEEEANLQQALTAHIEEKEKLNKQLAESEENMNHFVKQSDDTVKEKDSLVAELSELTRQQEDVVATSKSYQDKAVTLEHSLDTQKNKLTKELSSLQEAKDLLISQKLDVQKQVSNLQQQLKTEHSELEKTKARLCDMEQRHSDECRTMDETMREKKLSLEKIEREKDENEVRHEMQLTTLNENLTVIRTELTMTQDSVETSSKHADELRGQNLELEAKLENNSDERRVLLERCLESEGESEKLRDKTTELRRKLEDTQAALHDLGRENQSLQISTVVAQGRRWAEDSEVVGCMACLKPFSVTARKHHCRNCGNIFCNECSSKQASTPSSKKVVRVCDECFHQLSER